MWTFAFSHIKHLPQDDDLLLTQASVVLNFNIYCQWYSQSLANRYTTEVDIVLTLQRCLHFEQDISCVLRFIVYTALSISAPALRTAPQTHISHLTAADPSRSCQSLITPHKCYCQASTSEIIQNITLFIVIKPNVSGGQHGPGGAWERLQNIWLYVLFYALKDAITAFRTVTTKAALAAHVKYCCCPGRSCPLSVTANNPPPCYSLLNGETSHQTPLTTRRQTKNLL